MTTEQREEASKGTHAQKDSRAALSRAEDQERSRRSSESSTTPRYRRTSVFPSYALLGIPKVPTFSVRNLTTASGPCATCIPVGIAAVLIPGIVSLAIR